MRRFILLLALIPYMAFSQITISNKVDNHIKYFSIATETDVATILYDTSENILIKKSTEFLANDIEKISGKKPKITNSVDSLVSTFIVVSTIDNNRLIGKLITDKKIDVESIKGKWESFIIQTIENPFPGVEQALVIVGSDRRGAAYGVFTLTEKMGVSPWYWWADVPVEKHDEIYLENCNYRSNSPAVKYRGIFINDESPAFRYWAKEKFGGINHKCYEKIFELLLRNKANFMWPSMWLPTMFYVDDSLNPKTADEYGIVMSTSHHEPLTRAHNEWGMYNGGEW